MKVISVVWPYKLLALVELYVKLYVVNLGDAHISWRIFKLKISLLNWHDEAAPDIHLY